MRGARSTLQAVTDAFRMFDQPEKSYSWWDYRMLGFQKNRGLRIDHILVSEALRPSVTACSVCVRSSTVWWIVSFRPMGS